MNAQSRYRKKHIRQIIISLNRRTDADTIAYLESLPNIQGYLKSLIRAHMATPPQGTETEKGKDECKGNRPRTTD